MTRPPITLPVTLDDISAAAARIAPHVRRTPSLSLEVPGGLRVTVKLEQLQIGGSFKARGAVNKIATAGDGTIGRGVVTASGGNHGIGTAWAASRFGARATVFLPEAAPVSSERSIRELGAETVRGGAAWDDAWARAEAFAIERGAVLVHPFEDPMVIAGQGTVGTELLADAPDVDAVLVAIGGGGLAAGVALAAKSGRGPMRVIGVEPTGAPSMQAAMAAGRVVSLPSVHTIAGTLAPRAVGPLTLAFATALLDEIVLVSDDEMRAAMRFLWRSLRVLVEPAGAAAMAALLSGRANLFGVHHAGVIVCGANLDVDCVLGPSR